MSTPEFNLLTELNDRMKRIEIANAELLDSGEAAAFLRISKSTLEKMTSPGNLLIPVATYGGKTKVFMRSDLIAFVESKKQEAINQ